MVYRKKLSHLEFNLRSEKLELISSDKKYYYLKSVENRKGYRILRIENGEEIDIYINWLKN